MQNETEFPRSHAYQQLDLDEGSETERALMRAVDREAARPEITLTTDGAEGSLAGGITPAMTSWLGSYVGPLRQAALAELEAAARKVSIGKLDGILLELEEGRLKRHQVGRRADIYAKFHDNYGEMLEERNQADDEYERMRGREGGRDAQVPDPRFEWGVLFPLVLFPEGLLNFESFRRAPIISSDFMALGATILVGLGIAVAAHLLGTLAKQFAYYMRPDDEAQQAKGYRQLLIGSALLAMSLAAIATARYYYLLPLREQAIILGQTPPNVITQTSSLLIGNVVVFLIASAFTYLLHDADPIYSKKKRKLDNLNREFARLQRRNISLPFAEIDRALKKDVDQVRVIEQQMNGRPGYRELREEYSNFWAQDQKVVGLLVEYRARLCQAIHERVEQGREEPIIDRLYLSAERAGGRQRVSLADFEALPVKLYTC